MAAPECDPVPLTQAVGEAIQRHRKRLLWRQADLAEAAQAVGLPVTQTGIARIESGRNLTLEVIWKLALAMNVPPIALVVPEHVEALDLGGDIKVSPLMAAQWWMGLGPMRPSQDGWDYWRMVSDFVMAVHYEMRDRLLAEEELGIIRAPSEGWQRSWHRKYQYYKSTGSWPGEDDFLGSDGQPMRFILASPVEEQRPTPYVPTDHAEGDGDGVG